MAFVATAQLTAMAFVAGSQSSEEIASFTKAFASMAFAYYSNRTLASFDRNSAFDKDYCCNVLCCENFTVLSNPFAVGIYVSARSDHNHQESRFRACNFCKNPRSDSPGQSVPLAHF